MSQANVCIRMDKNIKEQFANLCDKLGLTMSTAINLFAKAVIRENGIPFELTLETPNKKTAQAIKDVENEIDTISIPYTNSKDVIQAILKDENED